LGIVSIDVGGDEQFRPKIFWKSSTLLRIALPDIPYTKIHTHDTRDIHIEFDYPNGIPKKHIGPADCRKIPSFGNPTASAAT